MRVEFIGEVEEVDRFVGKAVNLVEEVVEPLQYSQECSEAKEGEESAAVEFPKKSDNDDNVSAEKETQATQQPHFIAVVFGCTSSRLHRTQQSPSPPLYLTAITPIH
ncbi:hypothetical protein M0R45_020064 [Rubus argutus]|uniref:Uncharacterized protein n=1 Tax=Rubus argutus TaxID=59490 RepID=A0AAW1X828_RUBAR